MDQHLPNLLSYRRTTAIHVQKYRRVRASLGRSSPSRSVSTPTSRCDNIALGKAHDKLKPMPHSLSIDSASFPSCTEVMAKQSTHSGHSLPMSRQISIASSQSHYGSSEWSKSNSQSSADYSMTDTSGLITPDGTFSDFSGSFCESQPVVAQSPSLLYSELWSLGTDKFSSRDDALSSPKHGGRPELWINTKIDGSASELYEEPADSDPRDGPPCSRAGDPIAEVQGARKTEHLKSEVHGTFLSSATSLHHICPERLNRDIVNVSGVTPLPSLEGNRAERAAVPRCECHGLLKRPISASLEPGKILKIYRLYSRQMRNAQLTTLRHLQDKFETLWQKVRQAAPSLQSQMQQTLDPILDTPPTITDGLITLSLLSDGKPPRSLHEYISLVFFAKAWLSLGEQQGIAEVAYGLFIETSRCASVIPSSNAERDAYNILLQLLWQPFAATMSPPETHPLFVLPLHK